MYGIKFRLPSKSKHSKTDMKRKRDWKKYYTLCVLFNPMDAICTQWLVYLFFFILLGFLYVAAAMTCNNCSVLWFRHKDYLLLSTVFVINLADSCGEKTLYYRICCLVQCIRLTPNAVSKCWMVVSKSLYFILYIVYFNYTNRPLPIQFQITGIFPPFI